MSMENEGKETVVNHFKKDEKEEDVHQPIEIMPTKHDEHQATTKERRRNWLDIILAILGCIFVIVDVGSDALLAKNYIDDGSLYSNVYDKWRQWSTRLQCPSNSKSWNQRCYETPGYPRTNNWYLWDRRDKNKSDSIPKECDTFLHPYSSNKYGTETRICLWFRCRGDCTWYANTINGSICIKLFEKQYKRVILKPPPSPTFRMKYDSLRIFPFVTIGWIALGGLTQTIRLLILLCQGNEVFSQLPIFVKTLSLIVSPILLSPVVINLFIAYMCYKGVSDVELLKLKGITASLKLAEVITESLPQLITNAASIMLQCGDKDTNIYSNISAMQALSIATAVFGITYTTTEYLSKKKKNYIVSLNYHPLATLIGLFIWVLLVLLSLFFGFLNFFALHDKAIRINVGKSIPLEKDRQKNTTQPPAVQSTTNRYPISPISPIRPISIVTDHVWDVNEFRMYIAIVSAVLNLLMVATIIFTGICGGHRRGKIIKNITTCAHIACVLAFTVSFAVLFNNLASDKLFIFTILLWLFQFIFAVVILPSPHIGACLFNPFVIALFKMVRMICCGKFREQISLLEQWEANREVAVVVESPSNEGGVVLNECKTLEYETEVDDEEKTHAKENIGDEIEDRTEGRRTSNEARDRS